MPVYKGSDLIGAVYKGSTSFARIYHGATLVFQLGGSGTARQIAIPGVEPLFLNTTSDALQYALARGVYINEQG